MKSQQMHSQLFESNSVSNGFFSSLKLIFILVLFFIGALLAIHAVSADTIEVVSYNPNQFVLEAQSQQQTGLTDEFVVISQGSMQVVQPDLISTPQGASSTRAFSVFMSEDTLAFESCLTYREELVLRNDASVASTYSISFAPSRIRGWAFTPTSSVTLAAGESRVVEVYTSVPCRTSMTGLYSILIANEDFSHTYTRDVQVVDRVNVDMVVANANLTTCTATDARTQVHLTNTGSYVENYTLRVSNYAQFITLPFAQVELAPGQSIVGNITFNSNAFGVYEYDLLVDAQNSGQVASLPLSVDVDACADFDVTTSAVSEHTYCVKEPTYVPITITNNAEFAQDFVLRLSAPNFVSIDLESVSSDARFSALPNRFWRLPTYELTLNASEDITLFVRSHAPRVRNDSISVAVESVYTGEVQTVAFGLHSVDCYALGYSELDRTACDIDTEFPIYLVNEGDLAQNVSLSVYANSDVDLRSVDDGQGTLENFALLPGQQKDLRLISNQTTGRVFGTIVAHTRGTSIETVVPFSITYLSPQECYGVTIDRTRFTLQLNVSQAIESDDNFVDSDVTGDSENVYSTDARVLETIVVSVTNTGMHESDFTFLLSDSVNWARLQHSQALLAPGETVTVSIDILDVADLPIDVKTRLNLFVNSNYYEQVIPLSITINPSYTLVKYILYGVAVLLIIAILVLMIIFALPALLIILAVLLVIGLLILGFVLIAPYVALDDSGLGSDDVYVDNLSFEQYIEYLGTQTNLSYGERYELALERDAEKTAAREREQRERDAELVKKANLAEVRSFLDSRDDELVLFIEVDGEERIEMSRIFSDPDGDNLTYSIDRYADNIEVYIENEVLVIIPSSEFIGYDFILISAYDLESSTQSPPIYVVVTTSEMIAHYQSKTLTQTVFILSIVLFLILVIFLILDVLSVPKNQK